VLTTTGPTRQTKLRTAFAALMFLGVFSPSGAAAQGVANTGSTASFRGLGIAADGTIWISGTGGTVLRSTDGGVRWEPRPIADAKSFDLRDVEAVSASTAYALVAGSDTGRIYKTTDGGTTWVRQYDDTRKGIFLDGFAFWDVARGVAVGDPMDGRFVILRTEDGGASWSQVPVQDAPQAAQGEAVFAASGSAIAVGAGGRVWIGTGGNQGTGAGRVLRSADYGRTWEAVNTTIPAGTGSTGIFSLAFHDALNGVAVGGDYKTADADRSNVAITTDGGTTWRLGDTTGATGYLSAVAYLPKAGAKVLVGVGTAGVFASSDGGYIWRRLNAGSYNAVATGRSVIAAGDRGRVGVWPSLDAARDSTPPLVRKPKGR
jgi:photosystem II stability/assembly factor-like uncharacterized protein